MLKYGSTSCQWQFLGGKKLLITMVSCMKNVRASTRSRREGFSGSRIQSGLCHQAGFTLLEVMIAVAIVAVLAVIALPAYNEHVLRSRLVEGTNELAAMHVKMQQYFQDHRTYKSTGSYTSPCSTSTTAGLFTVSCASDDLSASAYTIKAQGSGIASSFTYTIDEDGTKATTASSWGTTSSSCWLMRSGDSC